MNLDLKIGVVHGRFQPFHIGHLDYVLKAKSLCDFLYVGIANPDPSQTRYSLNSPHRSLRESNPFTYYERQAMIRATLNDIGLSPNEYDIVPFPINIPDLIENYVPIESTFYMTIYDQWGREKKKMLEQTGLTVEVLEEGGRDLKKASGTSIRRLIEENGPWKNLVPLPVFEYIDRREYRN